jgi:outer membrane protein OmpA-like peptidoglycan-associated protein
MEHEVSHSNPGFGKNTNGLGLVIVALSLVVLALAAYWLWHKGAAENDWYRFEKTANAEGHEGHGEATSSAKLGMYDSLSGNYIYEVGNEIIITLPDSAKTELRVGANSTEAKLYKFLVEEGTKVDTVDKTKGWITCDRIFFETDKTVLTAESKKQISNITAIMNAFPAAEVKVGGYTDSTGSQETNLALSTSRAAHVLEMLKLDGAKGAISSEGYGSQWPIATNGTPEGRAMNRRTDIRVTKK